MPKEGVITRVLFFAASGTGWSMTTFAQATPQIKLAPPTMDSQQTHTAAYDHACDRVQETLPIQVKPGLAAGAEHFTRDLQLWPRVPGRRDTTGNAHAASSKCPHAIQMEQTLQSAEMLSLSSTLVDFLQATRSQQNQKLVDCAAGNCFPTHTASASGPLGMASRSSSCKCHQYQAFETISKTTKFECSPWPGEKCNCNPDQLVLCAQVCTLATRLLDALNHLRAACSDHFVHASSCACCKSGSCILAPNQDNKDVFNGLSAKVAEAPGSDRVSVLDISKTAENFNFLGSPVLQRISTNKNLKRHACNSGDDQALPSSSSSIVHIHKQYLSMSTDGLEAVSASSDMFSDSSVESGHERVTGLYAPQTDRAALSKADAFHGSTASNGSSSSMPEIMIMKYKNKKPAKGQQTEPQALMYKTEADTPAICTAPMASRHTRKAGRHQSAHAIRVGGRKRIKCSDRGHSIDQSNAPEGSRLDVPKCSALPCNCKCGRGIRQPEIQEQVASRSSPSTVGHDHKGLNRPLAAADACACASPSPAVQSCTATARAQAHPEGGLELSLRERRSRSRNLRSSSSRDNMQNGEHMCCISTHHVASVEELQTQTQSARSVANLDGARGTSAAVGVPSHAYAAMARRTAVNASAGAAAQIPDMPGHEHTHRNSTCAICLDALALPGLGRTARCRGGPAFEMPCCKAIFHIQCLKQCVQLRAIRKCCPKCQAAFDEAQLGDMLKSFAEVDARTKAARSVCLNALLTK